MLNLRWLSADPLLTPSIEGGRLVVPDVGNLQSASLSVAALDAAACRYTVQPEDQVPELQALLYPGLTAESPMLPLPGGVVQLPSWSCAWLQSLLSGAPQGLEGVPFRHSLGRVSGTSYPFAWLCGELGAVQFGNVNRNAVVALARSYAGPDIVLGTPRFEEVTQGRQHNKGYSACGDFWNFVLWRIGCRDPSWVNRDEPSAGLSWHVTENISRPHAAATKSGAWVQAKSGLTPKNGDLVLIGHYPDEVEHVFVHLEMRGTKWTSADYGQVEIGSGKPSSKIVARDLDYPKLGSRTLIGWIDLDKVPLSALADYSGTTVPSSFAQASPEWEVGALLVGGLALAKYLI